MQTAPQVKGMNRHYLVRLIKNRPQLFFSFLIGLTIELFLPNQLAHQAITRHIIALNAGAIAYLILATKMMFFSTYKNINQRSELQDEGQAVILILALGAVLTSLAAIVVELSTAKDMHGILRFEHIGLAILTIFTSWIFTHLIFAIHYAHDYYLNLSLHQSGGLEFPGDQLPDYADFLYFSCVIGTSGQTADVSFTSQKMRRIGAIHCVFSFFFNTTILALTINIASGLF